MSRPLNPPAFPSAAIDNMFGGMTLRDWFAGQALPVAAAYCPDDSSEAAKRAYAFADAMLQERNKSDAL